MERKDREFSQPAITYNKMKKVCPRNQCSKNHEIWKAVMNSAFQSSYDDLVQRFKAATKTLFNEYTDETNLKRRQIAKLKHWNVGERKQVFYLKWKGMLFMQIGRRNSLEQNICGAQMTRKVYHPFPPALSQVCMPFQGWHFNNFV